MGAAPLHLGAVRIEAFGGGELIAMDGARAASLSRSLGARRAIPVRYDSWDHFTEGHEQIAARLTEAVLANRLHRLTPGIAGPLD
ncbi:hypothetical protein GCM10010207_27560 [Streptomyces atratus]|uniref:hypothetical protein n=1 Tax=Streptomyces atratus TaxID=1893 RepID=UPI00166F6C9D|nr:hypothetical protein [Streptomyces atratus]GGT26528.1 hypothetical protein GCM10010207_27560 [Streptomyces atratus]